jgi:hypothetical protein
MPSVLRDMIKIYSLGVCCIQYVRNKQECRKVRELKIASNTEE